jgi:hypothetical protein
MPEIVTLSSADLPDNFLAETAARLHSHSVALVKVKKDDQGADASYHIGSGTLISIDNISGILTAQHVTNQLDGHCWLGLTIGREGESNAFKIEKNYFQVVEIGIPKDNQYGPDLAFIHLGIPDIGTIRASKSFHAVLPDRDELLSSPPPIDFGVWFMCGAAGERTKTVSFDSGFRQSLVFQLDCGVCEIEKEHRTQDHDYLEALVSYGEQTDPPNTFGGMSGGGLWQVTFVQSADGSIKAKQYYLSGVLFYESALENQKRSIRCHGRYSVYRRALDEIQAKCG